MTEIIEKISSGLFVLLGALVTYLLTRHKDRSFYMITEQKWKREKQLEALTNCLQLKNSLQYLAVKWRQNIQTDTPEPIFEETKQVLTSFRSGLFLLEFHFPGHFREKIAELTGKVESCLQQMVEKLPLRRIPINDLKSALEVGQTTLDELAEFARREWEKDPFDDSRT
jgi:hypothetical protein